MAFMVVIAVAIIIIIIIVIIMCVYVFIYLQIQQLITQLPGHHIDKKEQANGSKQRKSRIG